jgi:hypothetical protein
MDAEKMTWKVMDWPGATERGVAGRPVEPGAKPAPVSVRAGTVIGSYEVVGFVTVNVSVAAPVVPKEIGVALEVKYGRQSDPRMKSAAHRYLPG